MQLLREVIEGKHTPKYTWVAHFDKQTQQHQGSCVMRILKKVPLKLV